MRKEQFDDSDRPWTVGLQAKIKRGVSQFANGSFFRLESRSPKDNYWGEATNFRACSFQDVKKLLYSERLLDDLVRYNHLTSEPVRLLFREWHPIPKHAEFRCFIREGRIAGISQYHYAGFDEAAYETRPQVFAQVVGRRSRYEQALKAYMAAEILLQLPTPSLVVDLWVDHMDKITLIEVNPYGLSDPCLFTYPELEACEGEFRCVMPPSPEQGESD